jgi:hypothetical protein
VRGRQRRRLSRVSYELQLQRTVRALSTLIGLLLVTACQRAPTPAPTGDGPSGGAKPQGADSAGLSGVVDTLVIPVGRTAAVDRGRLTVEFRRVESDSRCPSNVQCVWEGDAAIALRVAQGEARSDTTLHTRLDPRLVTYRGYELSIVNLAPYPATDQELDSAAYVATLAVRH